MLCSTSLQFQRWLKHLQTVFKIQLSDTWTSSKYQIRRLHGCLFVKKRVKVYAIEIYLHPYISLFSSKQPVLSVALSNFWPPVGEGQVPNIPSPGTSWRDPHFLPQPPHCAPILSWEQAYQSVVARIFGNQRSLFSCPARWHFIVAARWHFISS